MRSSDTLNPFMSREERYVPAYSRTTLQPSSSSACRRTLPTTAENSSMVVPPMLLTRIATSDPLRTSSKSPTHPTRVIIVSTILSRPSNFDLMAPGSPWAPIPSSISSMLRVRSGRVCPGIEHDVNETPIVVTESDTSVATRSTSPSGRPAAAAAPAAFNTSMAPARPLAEVFRTSPAPLTRKATSSETITILASSPVSTRIASTAAPKLSLSPV
mmetsp:Transcript_1597/g.5270  ORF Transcript_1597/g.5270 Transcript_1597/m.5270 type:complete len:215 (+) Transcript_1597:807-1451(+)